MNQKSEINDAFYPSGDGLPVGYSSVEMWYSMRVSVAASSKTVGVGGAHEQMPYHWSYPHDMHPPPFYACSVSLGNTQPQNLPRHGTILPCVAENHREPASLTSLIYHDSPLLPVIKAGSV